MLDTGFLWRVRESGTGICHVSLFTVSETESSFEAVFPLFQGKFLKSDCINIHGIGVFDCFGGGGGEGLEGLSGPSTSLSDLFDAVPLVLEVDGVTIHSYSFLFLDLSFPFSRDYSSSMSLVH